MAYSAKLDLKDGLEIVRGYSYSLVFEFDVDVEPLQFRSQIRDVGTWEVAAEFTITKDVANRRITLSLANTETSLLDKGVYNWSLAVNDNGELSEWIRGQVFVVKAITEW